MDTAYEQAQLRSLQLEEKIPPTKDWDKKTGEVTFDKTPENGARVIPRPPTELTEDEAKSLATRLAYRAMRIKQLEAALKAAIAEAKEAHDRTWAWYGPAMLAWIKKTLKQVGARKKSFAFEGGKAGTRKQQDLFRVEDMREFRSWDANPWFPCDHSGPDSETGKSVLCVDGDLVDTEDGEILRNCPQCEGTAKVNQPGPLGVIRRKIESEALSHEEMEQVRDALSELPPELMRKITWTVEPRLPELKKACGPYEKWAPPGTTRLEGKDKPYLEVTS